MQFVMPTSLGSRLTALRGRLARSPLALMSAAAATAALAAALALVLTLGTAHGANFTVSSTADGIDMFPGDGNCHSPGFPIPGPCTLRAAIMEANALDGDDTITLPPGTYFLTNAGTGENAGGTGDLDIADFGNKLTITGAGAATTIINGGGIDRVIQVLGLTTLELSSVTITNGDTTSSGGGIFNRGTLTLTNSTVSGNTADGAGGGITNFDMGTATLTNVTVSVNTTGGSAGGIFNSGTLTLTNSTISGNTAAQGGGIENRGTLTLTNSTVTGNMSLAGGGGILNLSGTLTLTNSTVSGNTADGAGGGISNSGEATLTNSTVSGNAAAFDSGGILHLDGPLTLKNSIIAGNSAPDCDGLAVTSLGNNIDGDSTCNLAGPDDQPGVDPLLGPLADNGGPTQTQALLAGSPAINAGDDTAALAIDQRGFPRVGVSDIGAFEFQGPVGVDADGDGFDSIASGGSDCDDTNSTIFPGASETPYDGIDQDCDGSDLADVDGDGFDADQATGGTPDCDDTDATIFPGATEILDDGIDQDCDGEDAISDPEAVPTVTFSLVGGFNALVFPGADDTPIDDVATAIGSITDAIFRFDADRQSWLVYRPDVVVPGLNTLATANQRDVLFVRLPAGAEAALSWDDALSAGPVSVALPPGFTFVGFTGAADTALADLLAPLPAEVSAVFRYDAATQGYDIFRRGQPAFLSTVTTVDRLDGLFLVNSTADTVTLAWEQVAGGGP